MKTSCIAHPANEPLIIIREWQLEFCEGDKVAAALMSFFEYWHNIKLEMSAKNQRLIEIANEQGEIIEVDISLYQWHTYDDLSQGIMKLATSRTTIQRALDFLVGKGVITIHDNPNPRLKFDRTNHYLFHPEACVQFLDNRVSKNEQSSSKNEQSSSKNGRRPSKNGQAIPETTSKTTPKSTTEGENDPPLTALSVYQQVTKIKDTDKIPEAVMEWLNSFTFYPEDYKSLRTAIRQADKEKKVFDVETLSAHFWGNVENGEVDTKKRWFTDEEYEQLLGNTPAKPV